MKYSVTYFPLRTASGLIMTAMCSAQYINNDVLHFDTNILRD